MRYMLDRDKLLKLVRRARERWPDFEVLRVIQKRSKQILYVRAQDYVFKIIVHGDGRVRVFGPVAGAEMALKRMVYRVLGLEPPRRRGEEE